MVLRLVGRSFRAFFLYSILYHVLLVNGDDTLSSLGEQLREIKESLGEREVLDQQQRGHITQLAVQLQDLTSTMERYVTLLETGQMQEGEGVGSCATQLALIQTRLGSIEGKLDGGIGGGRERVTTTGLSQPPATTVATGTASSTCTSTLASIQPSQTVNVSTTHWGYWGRDMKRNDGFIYVALSAFSIGTIQEYKNEEELQLNKVQRVHNLSEPCIGTGHVVHDRHFYCARADSKAILRYSLDTDQLLVERVLSTGNSIQRTYQNGEGIDLSADDTSVWMVYAKEAQHHHIQLERLDPETLETMEGWGTGMLRRQIGQTFMICGMLYSLDSYSASPSHISQIFNPRQDKAITLEEDDITMPTVFRNCWGNARWPAYVAMMNYDPWDQALHVWNCGHLERYPVQFAHSSPWYCGN